MRPAVALVRAGEERDGVAAARERQHPAGARHHAVRARRRGDAAVTSSAASSGREPHGGTVAPAFATATLYRHARQDLGALEKVLRVGEGRRVKRLAEQAAYVTTLEPDFEKLSDAELAAKTVEFKQRLENGEALEELLFEAFAAVREARKRDSASASSTSR